MLHFLKLASLSTPHCHPTILTHICILIGTFFWLSFILFIFIFRKGLCIYNSFSFEQNSMKSTELLCSCLCLPQGHPPELSVHLCSWVNTVILDLRIHCWSPSNGSGQQVNLYPQSHLRQVHSALAFNNFFLSNFEMFHLQFGQVRCRALTPEGNTGSSLIQCSVLIVTMPVQALGPPPWPSATVPTVPQGAAGSQLSVLSQHMGPNCAPGPGAWAST